MSGRYDDIIRCSRPVSSRHLPMSRQDRAAQFAPFAALTGYDGVIAETVRLTDREIPLDVGAEAELDAKLRELQEIIHLHPKVTVTYFQPDQRKKGGAYVCMTGRIKRMDPDNRMLLFTDGTAVAVERIYGIS